MLTAFIFELLKTTSVVASRHNVGPLRAVDFFMESTYSMFQMCNYVIVAQSVLHARLSFCCGRENNMDNLYES